MYCRLLRTGLMISGAVIAPSKIKEDGVFSVNLKKDETETGWERIKNIFVIDRDGLMTSQLQMIVQTTFFTGFFGSCYGGFIESRRAYLEFFERNQASQFVDHLEAKQKLQYQVSMNFIYGACKYSWRIALFSFLYTSYISISSAYRGRLGIGDFAGAGLVSGALYKWNLGLKGMVAGGTVGTFLGLFAGSMTLLVFRWTNVTLDDIQALHYELRHSREKQIKEAEQNVLKPDLPEVDNMLDLHEKRIKSLKQHREQYENQKLKNDK